MTTKKSKKKSKSLKKEKSPVPSTASASFQAEPVVPEIVISVETSEQIVADVDDSGIGSPPARLADESSGETNDDQRSVASVDSACEVERKPKKTKRKPLTIEMLSDDIKHPLNHSWTLWTYNQYVSWNHALNPVMEFNTVEDFWSLFSNICHPSTAPYSYCLFKGDIKPEWEDPRNAMGGRWILFASGHDDRTYNFLWRELNLMLVGELEFDDLINHINGIYLKTKERHISIWLDTTAEDIVMPIGHIIQRILQREANFRYKMEFANFNQKSRSRGPKVMYFINGES